mmetsp:Transcript_25498/g.39142  ORF Transcript_25498/g.39142 Transcript_25498/m.39142 type:complete len:291 (+) Transcript_25498:722-1594(+)
MPKDNVAKQQNTNNEMSTEFMPKTKTMKEINFTPAFVQSSQSKMKSDIDPLAEVSDETLISATAAATRPPQFMQTQWSPNNNSEVSPPPPLGRYRPRLPTTKRRTSGPLTKELREIRGSSHGDSVRLQSGSYPFQNDAFWGGGHVSDPRGRASSFMDVTILSSEPQKWENDDKRVTLLCFVHSRSTKDDDSSRPEPSSNVSFPQMAEICFTIETVREQRVRRGAQLRIYDAIIVPSIRPPHVHNEASDSISGSSNSVPLILSTELCEPYPSQHLDDLPTIESIEKQISEV